MSRRTPGITSKSTRTPCGVRPLRGLLAQVAGHTHVRSSVGRLVALKQNARAALLTGVDILGLVLSVSGASVVALLGKAMLAVVLFAIALGFFLRISGRRKGVVKSKPSLPSWTRLASGLLAAAETAMLVEATNLPVRFHQPGFEPWHWVLVVVALWVAYALHMRLLAALVPSRNVTAQT